MHRQHTLYTRSLVSNSSCIQVHSCATTAVVFSWRLIRQLYVDPQGFSYTGWPKNSKPLQ